MRHPDDIMTDVDALAPYTDKARNLVWEIIEDLIDTVQGMPSVPAGVSIEHYLKVRDDIAASLTDYVTNHYGDD